LWSNLKELCDLLRIPAAPAVNDEEFLFQHVQFKTGQRIHTIGQPFDTLFFLAESEFCLFKSHCIGNEWLLVVGQKIPELTDELVPEALQSRAYRLAAGRGAPRPPQL
jgi:CRP/FNR family transcriptional regulator